MDLVPYATVDDIESALSNSGGNVERAAQQLLGLHLPFNVCKVPHRYDMAAKMQFAIIIKVNFLEAD